jgi:hypothetical protein
MRIAGAQNLPMHAAVLKFPWDKICDNAAYNFGGPDVKGLAFRETAF